MTSSLDVHVVMALDAGPKSFDALQAATRAWQSTLSAALAGLAADNFIQRCGLDFLLSAKGRDLITAARPLEMPREREGLKPCRRLSVRR